MGNPAPSGFLTFTLHAHLPYVVNHGTWPHGMEWLHEAAAETYLPLLRMFERLERDGLSLPCNLSLSPVLLEQLAHPVFQAEFPRYLERKVIAAREDESYFASVGDAQFAATARFWHQFFSAALQQFEALDRSIAAGFRALAERGALEIITCAATHGYMPLLGTDEGLRAQIRLAVDTHQRHLGQAPRGIWIPECGYRPNGSWELPVTPLGRQTRPPGTNRAGVEQALSESGLEFFFVDTHLVREGHAAVSPYAATPHAGTAIDGALAPDGMSRVYHPFFVASEPAESGAITAFSRDPQTGLQVWSADYGYPGEAQYLDFHKKRWPGGHRYWRVTGEHVDMGQKEPYDPVAAAAKAREHAEHFLHLVRDTLQPHIGDAVPPIVCSPFDAELFGHWWFEGPLWLEAVARAIHADGHDLALTACSAYLEQFQPESSLAMAEGSWGAGGNNEVWLNRETEWTYARLYGAELDCRAICSSGEWRDGGLRERIAKQLCRELLLLQSSDWQFLITTGAARDYAEQRFSTHYEQFLALKTLWEQLQHGGELTAHEQEWLSTIEVRDSIFASLDPAFWAEGARETSQVSNRKLRVQTAQEVVLHAPATSDDASRSQVQKFLPLT